MNRSSRYIPMDWRRAIANNETLAENQVGSVLFADVSGFTALTETFAEELGPKRGAEEFTVHLNQIFYGIVADLHNYGGSVVSFSGDAMTCWFNNDLDGQAAVTSALAMQNTMREQGEITTYSNKRVQLGIKLAVSAGQVRRFLVGLPEYLTMDAMAGRTLEKVTAAEGMAEKGEVVLDEETALGLEGLIEIDEWRTNQETGEKFAVISTILSPSPQTPWPRIENLLSEDTLREWILPSVYERLGSDEGSFLTQLRPTVAMFVRFSGLDYDHDQEAAKKLDQFICHMQKIVMRFGGNILQLTIGDKGSYVYIAFGAPKANEDDAERAASAAIELIQTSDQFNFDQKIQIGITQGNTWSGAYGGEDRQTYGVMGNSVNLAARLMMHAKPGQILLNRPIKLKIENEFNLTPQGEVQFKGKSYKTEVYELLNPKLRSGFHLFDAQYRFPMVGRQSELDFAEFKIDEVLNGKGQIIGITAEAGMGKSRLASEIAKSAMNKNLKVHGGECESFGTNNSYLVWENIGRELFGLSHSNSIEDQLSYLTVQVASAGEDLVARLPLLSPIVKLPIPDNDISSSLDPKEKKDALEGMLIDYLKYQSKQTPLLLLLEDIHWIDDLSKEFLELLATAIESLPILLVLVYRPKNTIESRIPDLSHFPYFHEIVLDQFAQEEVAILIRHKLMRFFGAFNVPDKLLNLVLEKTAGNPFYIEEILNYIKNLDIDMQDDDVLDNLDLPDSIHSLILSRLDQLSESQQGILRVASVIGRLFRTEMVRGVYPGKPIEEQINHDLKSLEAMDLTSIEKSEPEETYFFKHIVTQEVTYESLPFKTRSNLHARVGEYLEQHNGDDIDQLVDLLAFHFGRTENEGKKKKYLMRAGELAQESFANSAALAYYLESLPMLDTIEKIETQLKMGEIYEHVGEIEKARQIYSELLDKTENDADLKLHLAKIQIAFGEFRRKQGDFAEAESFLTKAHENSLQLSDPETIAKTLVCKGTLNAQQGNLEPALELYEQSLKISKELQNPKSTANVLNNMGIVAEYLGNFSQAKGWFEESLEVRRDHGLRSGESIALSNMAVMMAELGEPEVAIEYFEEALAIQRQIGNRWAIGNTLNNMGNAARQLEHSNQASRIYRESLSIYSELRDKWALAFLLEDVASLFAQQGINKKAIFLVSAADKLRKDINSPLSDALQEKLDKRLESARQTLGKSVAEQAWRVGRKLNLENAIKVALEQLEMASDDEGPDFEGAISYALNLLRNELNPIYVYHNITHTESDVMPNAIRLAKLSELSEAEMSLLHVAASFHDVGYLIGPVEHEARSCEVVRENLPRFNFTAEQIEVICEMIMATRIPQTPINLAGQILADADLDLLGRSDFPQVSERLRRELANAGNELNDLEWLTQQVKFLESHTYFTSPAIKTRQPQKEENINWLKNQLEQLAKEDSS